MLLAAGAMGAALAADAARAVRRGTAWHDADGGSGGTGVRGTADLCGRGGGARRRRLAGARPNARAKDSQANRRQRLKFPRRRSPGCCESRDAGSLRSGERALMDDLARERVADGLLSPHPSASLADPAAEPSEPILWADRVRDALARRSGTALEIAEDALRHFRANSNCCCWRRSRPWPPVSRCARSASQAPPEALCARQSRHSADRARIRAAETIQPRLDNAARGGDRHSSRSPLAGSSARTSCCTGCVIGCWKFASSSTRREPRARQPPPIRPRAPAKPPAPRPQRAERRCGGARAVGARSASAGRQLQRAGRDRQPAGDRARRRRRRIRLVPAARRADPPQPVRGLRRTALPAGAARGGDPLVPGRDGAQGAEAVSRPGAAGRRGRARQDDRSRHGAEGIRAARHGRAHPDPDPGLAGRAVARRDGEQVRHRLRHQP